MIIEFRAEFSSIEGAFTSHELTLHAIIEGLGLKGLELRVKV